MNGTLAPDGAVMKTAGVISNKFIGKAKVFENEEEAFDAISNRRIAEGDVLIIRYEGPKGGPGMREMLSVTASANWTGAWGKGSYDNGRKVFWCYTRIYDRSCFT